MKKRQYHIVSYLALALVLVLVVGTVTALAQVNGTAAVTPVRISQNATVVESPFTQAVRDVKDSVVGVSNYGMRSPGYGGSFNFGFGRGFGGNTRPNQEESPRETLQGGGSGVVIAPGFVLTNYHVVENCTRLEISVGEEDTYDATLIAFDEQLDLAVLESPALKLQPVVIGDSDLLNVGDWAICIGNPLSFTGTTTVGIISALNREIKNATTDVYGRRTENVNSMIQTDAAINSGNSGGGMFNVAGELVGIPSMKFTSSYYSSTTVEGIGMAIPINVAKSLIEDALSGKTIQTGETATGDEETIIAQPKPRIGVSMTNMNSASYAVATGQLPRGSYVTDVEKGAPAEKAGIKVGDIVVDVDGTIITSTNQMVSILQAKEAGQTVTLKVYRAEGLAELEEGDDIPDGEYMDITVELAILDDVKQ